ncbi:PspC domain-containing protein [Reichenbachiella versicolor]|uniref:PspC domain-containing protein n=1 Tax=Reichenbachiella versicolor TaxID=1821036 RepID=UPI000D6DCD66|nr:PspC domain-containing protein [Reichenbachiella versicolor]
MKKNISINISGIIFHIEEDGYTELKQYLDSVSSYFSGYEDSKEIIEDIESRVAEIFLSKLADGKQVITAEDVDALIKKMGTVSDFEAESDTYESQDEKETTDETHSQEHSDSTQEPIKKQLYRNCNRKILGGVASGIGHYFGIDALWVRLLFVILFFNVVLNPIGGFAFLIYVILWIVVPGSFKLEEDEKIKKLYRDPKSKVLGGVAGGLSAYLRADVSLIRVLFVVLIFASGAGLIIYIVLWMITPKAMSVTERMQMKGEAVTLNNIQESIKKSLKTEEGEESALAKILLFPFRLIAVIFEALIKLIGPVSHILIDIARVLVGAILVIIGGLCLLTLTMLFFTVLGVIPSETLTLFHSNIPLHLMPFTLSSWIYLLAYVMGFIPLMFLVLLGLSAFAKRIVFPVSLAWGLIVAFLVGGVVSVITIPMVISSFSTETIRNEEVRFEFDKEVITLDVNYVGESYNEGGFVRLYSHGDSVWLLQNQFTSLGKDLKDAKEHSEEIKYGVRKDGDMLMFDSRYQFEDKAAFRNQKVRSILYIPVGQKFVLSHGMKPLLGESIWKFGYDSEDIHDGNTWMFDGNGLKCLSCESAIGRSIQSSDRKEKVTFDFRDFSDVEVNGAYKVYLTQSDYFSVEVRGTDQSLSDISLRESAGKLRISDRSNAWSIFKGLPSDEWTSIHIKMPDIDEVNVRGLSTVQLYVDDQESFRIVTDGASKCIADIDVNRLSVKASGASKIKLSGSLLELTADVNDASFLDSYGLDAKRVDIKASDASKANIKTNKELVARASDLAQIKYIGSPERKEIDVNDIAGVRRGD